MKRRLVLLGGVLLLVLGLDVAASFLLLGNRRLVWRPQPPFGALTNDAQRAWLEERRAGLAAGAESNEVGRFDAELGWTLRPGASSVDGRFHVNGKGLRGTREYADEAPDDVLRIVACGDSYTFCDEVADAEAWPARVEAVWPEAEVLNYGVGGYGTDQALLRFQAIDPGPRVDVLLVGLLFDDVGRNVNRYRPRYYPRAASPAAKPRFLLNAGELELLPQPFGTEAELVEAVASGEVLSLLDEGEYWNRRWVPRFLEWSAFARLLGGRRAYAARALPRLLADEAGEPFRVTVALLEAFERAGRAHGDPLFSVLLFPAEEDLRGFVESDERYWSGLAAALEERGLAVLDLSGPLGDAWRSSPDGAHGLYTGSHLSPRGNRIVADAIEARLRAALAGRR